MTHTHQRFMAADTEREPYRADCAACNPKGNDLLYRILKGDPSHDHDTL